MLKEELHKIIEGLPEDKIPSALSLLQTLQADKSENHSEENNEFLNRFLADLLGSISSVIYDLAKEAEKRNDQILANRYNFSMKKVIESWEAYKIKTKK